MTWDKVHPEIIRVLTNHRLTWDRGARAAFNPRWPLYLWGKPGSGKTSVAGLIYQEAAGRPMWINAGKGFRAVASACAEPQPLWGYGLIPLREAEHWLELEERSLVVLDDIALRDRVSEAQFEVMQEFLNRRQGKPTVITGNMSIEQIAKVYDDRVASRIAAGTLIEIDGDDKRLEDEDVPF